MQRNDCAASVPAKTPSVYGFQLRAFAQADGKIPQLKVKTQQGETQGWDGWLAPLVLNATAAAASHPSNLKDFLPEWFADSL